MVPKTSNYYRLWQLLQFDKEDVLSIYFYAILNGLLQLSVPVGIQAIIGFVMGAAMVTSIYVLIFLVVMSVLIVGILQINQMKIIEKIQQKIYTRFAFEFVDKISKLDLYHNDAYYLPEKVNRFFDTIIVQKGFSKLLLDVPVALIQIVFGLILLSFYNPLFIIIGLIFVIILWSILSITGQKGLETNALESNFKYETISWIQELARIRSFKLSQDSGLDFKKADHIIVQYLKARTRHFQVLLLQYKSLVAFKVVITFSLLGGGVLLLVNQRLNIGEFVAAEIIIISILSATERLIKSLDIVYDVITGLNKLKSVTELPAEKFGTIPYQTQSIKLDLIDFEFAYPNGRKLFKNSTISILPETMVCLSGEANSGKSTMLKILSGIYGNYQGSFLLNEIPINNYNMESLRQEMGVFLNADDIFPGTIWENITMGRDIKPEKILEISEKIGFENLMKNSPFGFETPIDILGKNLSKSMIKKIMLLRAFCHEPKLLILEEPWLELEESKSMIIDYLASKPNNATIIVSTNDKFFASKCDEVYQIKNGKLTKK
jgi:ABC-type bacteriocin/lantibiotic exporter with double-glycine peptidase domain